MRQFLDTEFFITFFKSNEVLCNKKPWVIAWNSSISITIEGKSKNLAYQLFIYRKKFLRKSF